MRFHGGSLQRQKYGAKRPCIDLSVNMHPSGSPASLLEALEQVDIHSYPDGDHEGIRAALGERFATDKSRIVFGNGATELLWQLAFCLHKGNARKPSVILTPTFCEWQEACTTWDIPLREFHLDHRFQIHVREFCLFLKKHRPASVYLCRPNSPDGSTPGLEVINGISGEFPETMFILDESFLSMSSFHHEVFRSPLPNQVLLRSLTKDLAIPGIRLGYFTGPGSLCRKIREQRPYWNLNCYAIAAASWYAGFQGWQEHGKKASAMGHSFREALRDAGYDLYHSDTIYSLVKTPGKSSGNFGHEMLSRYNILLRDCSSYQLSSCWRVATPEASELPGVLASFRSLKESF